MNKKKKTACLHASTTIISSITWAIVIIACSLALKDTGGYEEIQYILSGGAGLHLLLLSAVPYYTAKNKAV